MRTALDIAAMIVAMALLVLAMFLDAGAGERMLAYARVHVGLSERTDTARLKQIIGINPRRLPWCGAFVGAMAKQAGRQPPPGYLRAMSWRRWGAPVSMAAARPGDVVVMRGHVTLFTRRQAGRVCGIGGNQSNQVRETCYRASRIVAVRR